MATPALDEGPRRDPGRPSVVPWRGPLDTETVRSFEERVIQQLGEPDHPVILDLRRVDYIDSAGLRFLLTLREKLAGCAAQITLVVRGESRVERTLRLVGFDRLFALVSRPVRAWRKKGDPPED